METTTQTQKAQYLHLGCGLNAPPNWDNIDASPTLLISKLPLIGPQILSSLQGPNWPESVQYGNIVKGLNVEDCHYDLIFASHVLEHLSLPDFNLAIQNIYRYLKPNGIFRFIVPNLEVYIESYAQSLADPVLSMTAAEHFMKSTLLGQTNSRKTLIRRFKEALSNSRHQWMWDEPSLLYTLSEYSFSQVRRCYCGDWSNSSFAEVESELCYHNSIGIEAVR